MDEAVGEEQMDEVKKEGKDRKESCEEIKRNKSRLALPRVPSKVSEYYPPYLR